MTTISMPGSEGQKSVDGVTAQGVEAGAGAGQIPVEAPVVAPPVEASQFPQAGAEEPNPVAPVAQAPGVEVPPEQQQAAASLAEVYPAAPVVATSDQGRAAAARDLNDELGEAGSPLAAQTLAVAPEVAAPVVQSAPAEQLQGPAVVPPAEPVALAVPGVSEPATIPDLSEKIPAEELAKLPEEEFWEKYEKIRGEIRRAHLEFMQAEAEYLLLIDESDLDTVKLREGGIREAGRKIKQVLSKYTLLLDVENEYLRAMEMRNAADNSEAKTGEAQ